MCSNPHWFRKPSMDRYACARTAADSANASGVMQSPTVHRDAVDDGRSAASSRAAIA